MEYLKKAPLSSASDRLLIQQTVSEILLDIERHRTEAIRRYSAKFDGWNPPLFRVSAAQISEAEEEVDSKLRAHIEFSRGWTGDRMSRRHDLPRRNLLREQ